MYHLYVLLHYYTREKFKNICHLSFITYNWLIYSILICWQIGWQQIYLSAYIYELITRKQLIHGCPLSQSYHSYCHSRTTVVVTLVPKAVVTLVPRLWNDCDNSYGTSVTIGVATVVPVHLTTCNIIQRWPSWHNKDGHLYTIRTVIQTPWGLSLYIFLNRSAWLRMSSASSK